MRLLKLEQKRAMFFGFLLVLVAALFLNLSTSLGKTAQDTPRILFLQVEGTVTAGTTHYLKENIERAKNENMTAIIINIDTPGGLVDATLDISKDMLNSPVPIITFVSPRGAIAASAGTFILIAGHIAVMAPGTTCGAAMPITMRPGGEGPQPADQKTINFLAGHMQSIARQQNRPADLAKHFVTENLTLGAEEAKEKEIIDLIAGDLTELLSLLDGYTVTVLEQEVTLSTVNAEIIKPAMTTLQRIIHLISNPQVAFLLFLIGLYGIIFGLNMPGTYVPEVTGVVALILALFGLGMFEIDIVGILLITVSVIFFTAEAMTPTFGVLTAAGLICLVLGALFLPVEPMLPAGWFHAFRLTVLGMAAVTGAFLILVVSKLTQLRKLPPLHTQHGLSNYYGKVVEELNPEGLIKIRGEWWQARSSSGETIHVDTMVTVKRKQGAFLEVEERK